MNDSETGADRAPTRYTQEGRETVDRMRDTCREQRGAAVGDRVFATACDTHALKYRDRAGHKGEVAVDLAKARWWEAMARCVRFGEPDPRAGRESGPTGWDPLRWPRPMVARMKHVPPDWLGGVGTCDRCHWMQVGYASPRPDALVCPDCQEAG